MHHSADLIMQEEIPVEEPAPAENLQEETFASATRSFPRLARRSRPFLRGGISRQELKQREPSPPIPSHSADDREGNPKSAPEAVSTPGWSAEMTDEENDIRDKVGAKVTLEAFALGPEIRVSPEMQNYMRLPAKYPGDYPTVLVDDWIHEFSPQAPGQHGILYTSRSHSPEGLVTPLRY